jgi:hypothetical protein
MDDAQRLKLYEDLLLALDGTLADMESAKRKGYLAATSRSCERLRMTSVTADAG